MLGADPPVGDGGGVDEVVAAAAEAGSLQVVVQLAAGDGRHVVAGVGAGLVQGHRVEGSEHAHIRDDGQVVLAVAVTVGGNVDHQIDVEVGPVLHHRLGILGNAAVQLVHRRVVVAADGVKVAVSQAAAAARALVVVDIGGAALTGEGDGVLGADLGAGVALAAEGLVHIGLARSVLLQLARTASAAHAQVLQRAAEAGVLVALEVVQADDHIRVHDGPADLGVLHVLAALHGYLGLVGALQTVGNDDLAAGGLGGEAVFHSGVHVLQRVLAAAHIQGVAVGQKRPAAQLLDHIGHGLGVVGPQVSQVARLTKVDLDGNELALHIDLTDTRGADQLLQLIQQVHAGLCPQVGEIDLCLFHGNLLHSNILFQTLIAKRTPGPGRMFPFLVLIQPPRLTGPAERPPAPRCPGQCGTSRTP